ncbi:MAG: tail fiber domain-containing protein [Acidobacteriota bacterium]|nr:tail fiber domain-containing protein [Acidobacteriota bacterium]
MKSKIYQWQLILLIVLFASSLVTAQTTEFTYQGKLSENSSSPTANYDFEFRLFDAETGGTALATQQRLNVPVLNGVFNIRLDFGANFDGGSRWLEIAVKPAGSNSPLTTLAPRMPINSTPYSIRSLNAAASDALSDSCVGCVKDSNISSVSGSKIAGEIPIASVPAGSTNYIRNTNSPQANADFNISGTGAANKFNAATQYDIAGSRVFTVSSFSANVFAGIGAGNSNGLGGDNSFFGHNAGRSNVSGANNSFFGRNAGQANTASNNSFFGAESGFGTSSGTRNSFFGQQAGRNNQIGNDNAFFGNRAGANNTSSENSFFGSGAGDSNTSGVRNSFFGFQSGAAVLTGSDNSFFGFNAGQNNTASSNSFFGSRAGISTTTGSQNSFFGHNAGTGITIGEGNSFFGFQAGRLTRGSANSFFGAEAGAAISDNGGNSFFGYHAGKVNTASGNSFFGNQAGSLNTTGNSNSFFGSIAGADNTTGHSNSFFGWAAGTDNTTGNGNSYFGYRAGSELNGNHNTIIGSSLGSPQTSGDNNTFVGYDAGTDGGFNDLTSHNNTAIGANAKAGKGVGEDNATALGADAKALEEYSTAIGAGSYNSQPNSIRLGRVDGSDKVLIAGDARVSGFLTVGELGEGGSLDICMSGSSLSLLSRCSSSLRYKTNVQPFIRGLETIRRLRPISFNWKDSNLPDIGFGAEEVAETEPLLTTRNGKNEIEGVKYGQISAVLVNAVKEQQAQIEAQEIRIKTQAAQIQSQTAEIKRQQALIENLRVLVCRQNTQAEICREEKK